MSLDWHKESLSNTYKALERKKAQLEQLQKDVERDAQRATFYHIQVREAEIVGKDGFDSELYLQKQKHHYIK